MTAIGDNAHIFARPSRRLELRLCLEALTGSGAVASVEWRGIAEPMGLCASRPVAA